MVGLCGLLFRDDAKHCLESDVEPMLGPRAGPGAGRGSIACFGRGGFGAGADRFSLTGLAERRVRGARRALAFHGNVYNPADFLTKGERLDDLPRALLDVHEDKPLSFLSTLRGEYALALWDGESECLYLATDPFQVCRVFYHENAESFVFASTIQSIRASPHARGLSIDAEAIVDFLAFEVIPTPRTIYRQIKKLPAGSVLCCKGGRVEVKPYWQVDFLAPSQEPEDVLAERVRAAFRSSIAMRVAHDVGSGGIGASLSGGLDSSTVTGVLTQVLGEPIKAFSIGFAETAFNELDYARVAAKAFSAEHHEYLVTPEDTLKAVSLLGTTYDEPYGNSSAIPTYHCARLARENGVDILYAGDGGDELFAGNKRYADQALFDRYHDLPAWVKKPFEPLVNLLADRAGLRLFVQARKFIRRANVPYVNRLNFYGLYEILPMRRLFSTDFLGGLAPDYDPYALYSRLFHEARAESNLDHHLSIDHKLTLGDNDLPKVTRMTAAAGLAVRYPFLDRPFAELAATVPSRLRMRGTRLRTFYKRAYSDFLPREILRKKKHGFGLPIAGWLRSYGPLNDLMKDLVLSRRSLERGYFRREAVEQLVGLHESDSTTFYGTILWYLMMLELWHREHHDGKAAAVP